MKHLYTAYFQIKSRLKLFNNLAAVIVLLLVSLQVQAQVGVGTITPNASAQLDVSSTNKGILIPRMNRVERDLIATPATGLLIFQTDETPGFYYYNGTVWGPLVSERSSAIIPFASGSPVTLIPPDGTMGGVAALIGFGTSSSTSGVSSFINEIDLTGGAGQDLNLAFSVPRSGAIESISGYFSTTQTLIVPFNTINITAQLYKSSVPDNVFRAIPGASVYFGYTGGIVQIGSIGHGITENLNIPINAQDRLLLVFYATSFNGQVINNITGYASAGISIK